jgi:UDP-glucose 4-epimerase
MNVLILGGLGYLGYNIAYVLKQRGCNVVLVDNLVNSSVQYRIDLDFPMYITDVKDISNIRNILEIHCITHVIWSLDILDVYSSEYMYMNTSSLVELLRCLNEMFVRNFIYLSSNEIYGSYSDVIFSENSVLQSNTIEGRMKSLAETIISSVYGGNVFILRIGHVVGVIPEVNIRNCRYNIFTQIFMCKNKIIDNVVISNIVQDYIHILDFTDCVYCCLLHISNVLGVNIYNIGSGNRYSDKQIVEIYQKKNNCNIGKLLSDFSVSCVVDVSKTKQLLNWSAKYNISIMCKI